ncbi:MAG: ComEA family DNA-binding protein [Clostridiales bacterium]|nr:ComEA family DNA-binding protein [Clostridiales bacterium]
MIKRNIVVVLLLLFVIASGFFYSCKYNADKSVILSGIEDKGSNSGIGSGNSLNKSVTEEDIKADEPTGIRQQARQTEMIAVHICGAIKEPGVYELEEGARLYDLIVLSGGLNEDAAGDYINQAQKLTDGKRYYIPTVKELEDLSIAERLEGTGNDDEDDGREKQVNINTADAAELMTLPGIGEAKANSIIEYRNTNGKFKTIEDLMKIPGIKEGLFNRIASRIVAE